MTHTTTTQAAYYVAYVFADRAGLAHRSLSLATAEKKMARLNAQAAKGNREQGTRCIVKVSGTYRPDKVSTTRPDQVLAFVTANDLAGHGCTLPAFLVLAQHQARQGQPEPVQPEPVKVAAAPEPQPEPEPVAYDDVDRYDDDDFADDDFAEMGSDEASIMAEIDYASAVAGIDF